MGRMTEKKAEKPFAVSSHDIHLDSDYIQWIHSVKERFRNTQIKTAVKINYEQLYFNWQMGRDLAVRRMEEKWGSGIVEQISLDLKNEFSSIAAAKLMFDFLVHNYSPTERAKTILN